MSVVIPTHNRATMLSRAIRSVQAQTYSNLEIIVVDDASMDDTQNVLSAISDPRVRYIRHPNNRGGSAARNTGILAARGEFTAFLDDDDEWEKMKTEMQLELLRRYEVALCTCNMGMGDWQTAEEESLVTLDDLRRGRFTSGGTSVLMARSSILKETLFDECLPRYQDWDLFVRLAHRCQIGFVNKPFVVYNDGAHGRISNRLISMSAVEIEAQLLMLSKHREFFGPRWYRRHMSRALLYGLRSRRHKIAYLWYVVNRYGLCAVLAVLFIRLRLKAIRRRDSSNQEYVEPKVRA